MAENIQTTATTPTTRLCKRVSAIRNGRLTLFLLGDFCSSNSGGSKFLGWWAASSRGCSFTDAPSHISKHSHVGGERCMNKITTIQLLILFTSINRQHARHKRQQAGGTCQTCFVYTGIPLPSTFYIGTRYPTRRDVDQQNSMKIIHTWRQDSKVK